MLYAGQEFGERGMDKEGFSGRDGRTTIFDYWTVQALYHGYVNRRKLTDDEKALEKTYSLLLNLANKEKAVSNGLFFDLMYANQDVSLFNPSKQYAFMRKCANEVLLVVVNFAQEDAECSVCLPRHAFEYLEIPEKTVTASDLLSKEETLSFDLKAESVVKMSVPGLGGRVYKFTV